jgi:hypothetical protein
MTADKIYEKFGLGETHMKVSSHPILKIIKPRNFYEGSPHQGLSEARQGNAVFTNMFIDTDPPRGRPVGGGGVHRK